VNLDGLKKLLVKFPAAFEVFRREPDAHSHHTKESNWDWMPQGSWLHPIWSSTANFFRGLGWENQFGRGE
jgi:hypothetical protein